MDGLSESIMVIDNRADELIRDLQSPVWDQLIESTIRFTSQDGISTQLQPVSLGVETEFLSEALQYLTLSVLSSIMAQ